MEWGNGAQETCSSTEGLTACSKTLTTDQLLKERSFPRTCITNYRRIRQKPKKQQDGYIQIRFKRRCCT